MAYKARRSGRTAAPVNQQNYYSTHGYDQSYATQDYNQTYDYSYGYGYDYNTMAAAGTSPTLNILIRPAETVGKNKTFSPPLVLEVVNPVEGKEYSIMVLAHDAAGNYHNPMNKSQYFSKGTIMKTANWTTVDAQGTTKMLAGFEDLSLEVAGTYDLTATIQEFGPDGATGGESTKFRIKVRNEAVGQVPRQAPNETQRVILDQLGVPY
ncbi:hypothetical protein PFICI_12050 [Pestalotiopsis fici W106-1]|uniref:Velvet domain-containing protein n=1 Tax=Pestalotiopsis fici (strain W106-1 / CGMCC3.15140) TaxID=1229662 RepID=W3WS43_PESFW|nr:uncharacterized protein PFICI_12050 [Pestalotiopsis fici W106-1]ETS76663.1 hypothetical protein PFICI_12050 [Pestalotiopsis fici W106-1]